MTNRILTTVIALILALGMLCSAVADGYFNEEGYPICDEPIDVTVAFVATGTNHNWETFDMYNRFLEDFGIRLHCLDFASGEDLKSQFTMWLASDSMPDMMSHAALSMNDAAKYGSEGYLLNLADYLEYMPNLCRLFEMNPDYRPSISAPDGGIYGLATVELNVFGRVNRVYINRLWLENVGMEQPQTIDELYDVLVAFRDNDANGNGDPDDEIPFGFNYGAWDKDMLLAAFGILTGDPNYSLQADENGEVYLANMSENYRAYLEFLHKCYDENLIDRECFVIDNTQRQEKVKSDVYGLFAAPAPFAWAGKNMDYDANFNWVAGLTSDYNDIKYIPLANSISNQLSFIISAKTEYPEALCRLIDWALSEEGEVTVQRGWEGINMEYQYNDIFEGYIANMIIPAEYTSQEDYKLNKVLLNQVFGPYASRSVGTHYRLLLTASDEAIFGDAAVNERGWSVLVERGRRAEGVVETNVFPALIYLPEEAEARATLVTDISNYVQTAAADFIIGKLDLENDWDSYIATLNGMKLDELLEIENAAYSRLMGN